MTNLDDTRKFAEIDVQDMLAYALSLPQTCADAWELGEQTYPAQLALLPSADRDGAGYDRIVIVGMGGSAMGGDLLAALVADECPCPILIQRNYDLPAFARGPRTLVIGCSLSGDTEETLSAVRQAHERGTTLIALSTGGELAWLAAEWGAPLLRYRYDSQPRAALGYSFTLLVRLLCELGLIADKRADVVEAVDAMHAWQTEIGPGTPLAVNPAKRLAESLLERLPIIYGAGLMEPVARRWKTQLNENSKRWAFFEAMPELNHNAVVGYARSERMRQGGHVVMLRSRHDSDRVQTRWRVTHEMLRNEGIKADQVQARGQSRLAQMLSLIHFGDLASVYLALASGEDPTPVTPIAYLKERLAQA
jgi:glucose/mannose-6-phosphate isomerase